MGRLEQLLQEEGVTAGPLVQLAGRPVRRGPAVDRGQEPGHLGRHEPLQPQVQHGVPALQPLDQLGDRVLQGQLLRAVRAHHHQPPGRGVHQPLDDRHALRVGPVQVVHDEHGQPGPAGGRPQQVQAGVQALVRGQAGVVQPGQGGLVGPPDQVQQKVVRLPERARIRLPDEYPGLRRHRADQLGHQPGLADPRLAPDQRDGCPGAGPEQAQQLTQLGIAADHDRAESRARDEHVGKGTGGDPSRIRITAGIGGPESVGGWRVPPGHRGRGRHHHSASRRRDRLGWCFRRSRAKRASRSLAASARSC